MKSKWITLTVATLVAGLLTIWSVAPAGPFNAAKPGNTHSVVMKEGRDRPIAKFIRAEIGRLMLLREELDITDGQREELKAIFQVHKSEIKTVAWDLVDARRDLREATLAENPDEATIRAAAERVGEVTGDAAVLASEIAGEVRDVLTDEQIALLQFHATDREYFVDQLIDQIDR